MKKGLIVFVSACMVLSTIQAQKKYEKIFYVESATETNEMSFLVKNPVSTKEFTKFNLKIHNKSEDALIYKPEESKLKANGKEYTIKEKSLEIAPGETESKVIDVNGGEFLINDYSYEVNGIYKLSTTSNSVEASDFQLPPSQNEFKAGNFTCTMSDLKKETDKTNVKFECRYTGDKVGLIFPGRAAVKLPDGTEIANSKSKASPVFLQKGESKKITLQWNRMAGGKATDMQLINLMIIWRNTFIEAEPVKVKPVVLEFKIDETKSK